MDGEQLPSRLKTMAKELAEKSGSQIKGDPSTRDGIHYELSVAIGDKAVTLELSSNQVPPRFEPLFEHLVKTSKTVPPR